MNDDLEKLLQLVKVSYEQSDIKKNGLYYSLITGSLQKNQPLLIGFNWGGTWNKPQTNIEASSFLENELGSLSRILNPCNKYFGSGFLNNASQTNYCFFRSRTEKEISSKDLDLCKPIFDELLKLMSPSIVLCFSSQLRNYLLKNQNISEVEENRFTFKRGNYDVTCLVAKGFVNGIKFVFLPHPMSQIPSEVRESTWEFAYRD